MKNKSWSILAAIVLSAGSVIWAAPGCGSNGNSQFDAGGPGDMDGSTNDETQTCDPFCGSDGATETAPPCVNLQCQIVDCGNGSHTTISGTVYDPAAINGLYNVYVYVPNANLDPIKTGIDSTTCTACQAPASGSPVVATQTDAKGNFQLMDVPVGSNIPLVMQLGKWRRRISIPVVTQCVDNPLTDKNQTRLPKKQAEGDPMDNIPSIAQTTGCDGAECFFLKRIGIDQSEFTNSSGGKQRVHIYKSANDDGQTFSGSGLTATALWNNPGEMNKYDIVFDACECSTYDRGPNGYKNLQTYLNQGGRSFATHYFYNFFASLSQCGGFDPTCQGPPDFNSVGQWEGNKGIADDPSKCPKLGGSLFGRCMQIDTGFPKGKAFADWYKNTNTKLVVGGGEAYGYAGLTDIRNDMGLLDKNLVAGGQASAWLYNGTLDHKNLAGAAYDAYYFSFNTPVKNTVDKQCGKAIFSDVHLAEAPTGSFPSYCEDLTSPTDTHAPDKLALEFLFFDLSSCVQDDTKIPPPPPPN